MQKVCNSHAQMSGSWFNRLTPKIDHHLIYPYNITSESLIKVMRIKEIITN